MMLHAIFTYPQNSMQFLLEMKTIGSGTSNSLYIHISVIPSKDINKFHKTHLITERKSNNYENIHSLKVMQHDKDPRLIEPLIKKWELLEKTIERLKRKRKTIPIKIVILKITLRKALFK